MCSRTVADSRANIEAASCSSGADRGAVVAVAGVVGTTFPFGDTCQADSSVALVQAFDCLGCFACTGVGVGGVARRSVWAGGGAGGRGQLSLRPGVRGSSRVLAGAGLAATLRVEFVAFVRGLVRPLR